MKCNVNEIECQLMMNAEETEIINDLGFNS